MNKVILIGRLTRNPEIRYSQNENSIAVARFTLAVDRRFKRDNEATADFINCVAFGKTADFFERYTRQGSKMAIEGRIQTGSYVKQDGTKVYTTDVIVENAEFADSKAPGQGQQMPAGQGQPMYAAQGQPMYAAQGQPVYAAQGQSVSLAQGYQNQYQQPAPVSSGYQSGGFSGQESQNTGFTGQGYQEQNYDSQDMQAQESAPSQYQEPAQYSQPEAPMQEAADEGFMQIPDELNDEGLPFG